jgi:inorganic phosphate transporter, PiT family
MAGTATITRAYPQQSPIARKLQRPRSRFGWIIFVLAIAAGIGYIATEITRDMESVQTESVWPFLLLALALLIALGFEFVNGFHDTANAVATVIYTHSLEPNVAVV